VTGAVTEHELTLAVEAAAKRGVEAQGLPWVELLPYQQHVARQAVLSIVQAALEAVGDGIAHRAWAEGAERGFAAPSHSFQIVDVLGDNPYPEVL